MSSYMSNRDPGDESDAAELDEIFIDEKTRRIAEKYEPYREEYDPPKTKTDHNPFST